MFPKSFNNNIVHGGDGSSASAFLFDASPANLGAPAGMLVESPLSDLDYKIPAL